MNIKEAYKLFSQSSGVCTDTRKLEKNNLYIALKGDNFNGNNFAKAAINQGAIAAIVDENGYDNSTENIYQVADGLQFLQQLAQYHRQQLEIPIIGLTGSNGKTTTKELIAACLSKKLNVAYTQGNLNNHIGVPLTLLGIERKHDIAVIEMGANHLKEIELLCNIAEPDYGYITNFGKAHLEGFGSFEGVVQGKSEMYKYLKNNRKTAFLNIDDILQIKHAKGIESITFGIDNEAKYKFNRIRNSPFASIQYKDIILTSNLIGRYNESNIAAAVTMAMHFGVEVYQIQKALEEYTPSINRSQVLEKAKYKIILDAYNANPSSMEVALKNFANLSGTKTAILGDMFELGDSAELEHQAIARLAQRLNIDEIYLVGNNFMHAKTLDTFNKFKNRDQLIEYLREHAIKTDNILIKGSRGMALEKILDVM